MYKLEVKNGANSNDGASELCAHTFLLNYMQLLYLQLIYR